MKFSWLTALAATLTVTTLSAQETISGALSSEDTKREGAYFYDAHTIQVNEPRIIKLWLNSDEFDAYLIVKTPSGTELSNDDNEGSNSYVEVFAEETGTYTVWASTYNEGSTGEYELQIEKSDRINISRSEGRLDPRDEQLPKGEYVDTHMIKVDTDDTFSIRLKCYGFDGYLVVTSPSGQIWRNDDAGDDYTISMVSDLSPEKGEWKVQVTTLEIEEVGAYDLEVITMD